MRVGKKDGNDKKKKKKNDSWLEAEVMALL